MKSSNTASAQLKSPAPIVEGNKGFTYATPVNSSSLGTSISFEAATKATITAKIPRQVQLCMEAWLSMSNGSGFVDLDKLNTSIMINLHPSLLCTSMKALVQNHSIKRYRHCIMDMNSHWNRMYL